MKRMLAVLLLAAVAAGGCSARSVDRAVILKTDQGEQILVKPTPRLGFFGRLVNGVQNVVTAPLDVPCTVVRHTQETDNPLLGLFTGVVEGSVNCTVRATAGVTEVITSPVPGKRYPLYDRQLGERMTHKEPEF